MLLALALSLLLAFLAHKILARLYARKRAILSHADAIEARARPRRLLLWPILFLVTLGTLAAPPAGGGLLLSDAPLASAAFALAFRYGVLLAFFSDAEQSILPDRLLLPLAALGLGRLLFFGIAPLPFLAQAAIAACAFLLLALLTGGIGGGDIRLVLALGLWLPREAFLLTLFAGFLLGGLVAFFLLVTRRKKRTDFFPYGPAFLAPALLISYL